VLSNACASFGWKNNTKVNKPLLLKEDIMVYPEKYFSSVTGNLSFFRTYAIHIATATWCDRTDLKNDFLLPLRKWHNKMMFNYWWFKHIHSKRKKLQKLIMGLFKR